MLAKVREWREAARQLIVQKYKRSKKHFDRRRERAPTYHPGDLVLVSRNISIIGKTKKLLPKFIGSFQVLKRVSETCFKVEVLPGRR